MIYSNKNKWATNTHSWIDNIMLSQKSRNKRNILHDSIYVKCKSRPNLSLVLESQNSACPWRGLEIGMGHRSCWNASTRLFLNPSIGYTPLFMQIHWAVHFWCLHFLKLIKLKNSIYSWGVNYLTTSSWFIHSLNRKSMHIFYTSHHVRCWGSRDKLVICGFCSSKA